MKTIAELKASFSRPGRLEWIGLSPARRQPLVVVDQAVVAEGTGLDGDHHARSGKSQRQVTLIQQEHFAAIASLAGLDEVRPEQLRRNLVVSGINLLMLKEKRFCIGGAWFEGAGICAPCSRMEETIGPGGYNAARGHGGITAKVIRGGVIRIHDAVVPIDDITHEPAD
ncbi:MAG: MOSC domain-containing protein [Planctomycetota bacterium]